MNLIEECVKYGSSPYSPEPGIWRQKYRFPADFIGFQGHFPGKPILPAFLQIYLVRSLWNKVFEPTDFLKVATAKFTRPITPEEPVEIELNGRKATIFVGDETASSMRLSC